MKPSQVFLLAISIFAITTSLYAQPHTVELLASDGKGGDVFGSSVAIRGNFAVVGAPGHGGGTAYVFENLSGTWIQIAELTPFHSRGNIGFGSSIAISDAGDTIAVGARLSNNELGGIFVFVEPPTGWADMTEAAQLSTSGAGKQQYGTAVAISGDGTQIVSGASHQGAAAFTKPVGGWATTAIPTAQLVVPSSASAFGSSLAIGGGNLVVGAELGSSGTGAAYVYKLSHLNGQQHRVKPLATLTPSDGASFDVWESVSIAGHTIVAGAPDHTANGAAYVFVEPSSGWADMTQTAELTMAGSNGGDFMGLGVAASDDLVLVGAPFAIKFNTISGEVFAYRKPATGWVDSSTPDAITAPPDGGDSDGFGQVLALDGNEMIVGAQTHDTGGTGNQGAAYIVTNR